MKVVNKAIKVRIYPTKADRNDNGEKKANIGKIESNFGIYRFIYDETLIFINNFKNLLLQYGYNVEKNNCKSQFMQSIFKDVTT